MKINIGDLNLKISLEFEEETKMITVKSIESTYESVYIEPKEETRKINQTESRYYILTFGSTSTFGKDLPAGETINVEYNNNIYKGKVHSTTVGRLDSLGEMFRENDIKEDDVIKAIYIADKRLLKVEKLI